MVSHTNASSVHRPRTIVTADPELDDLNSMIRLVLYSNDLQIDGLIYASSRYHWKGDGKGTTFFLPDREYAEPQRSWRWAEGERFIDDVIDAYAVVHTNLAVHDPRYPSPDQLRSVVREGNVSFEGDTSEESPGSRLIEDVLLDDNPEPVHLQVWAGTSTIARALLSIEARYRGTSEWERVQEAVSAKARITKFDSQDATYDGYIRPNWPGIMVTEVKSWTWGYSARHLALPQYKDLLEAEWMRKYVTSVGPLGHLYRTWGDGRRMVESDPTDYFHLSGYTSEQLIEMGFQVWTDPQPAGGWISEGDSTNMLNLFPAGLRGYEHPTYGGWGGRASRTGAQSNEWSVEATQDRGADGGDAHEYSVTRWFADAQNDFAARLRWSVSPAFGDANHHPLVSVTPGSDLYASPGETVALTASVTEPDGGSVTYRWWHYREAGSSPSVMSIGGADSADALLHIPADAVTGETLHVILEVTDDGDLPLKAYQRVIVTVR